MSLVDREFLTFELKLIEARKEEEQRRRNKYAKMEAEREKVREGIREKVFFIFFL
jgi:hypothetical protein